MDKFKEIWKSFDFLVHRLTNEGFGEDGEEEELDEQILQKMEVDFDPSRAIEGPTNEIPDIRRPKMIADGSPVSSDDNIMPMSSNADIGPSPVDDSEL